jgi:hypothetical protein
MKLIPAVAMCALLVAAAQASAAPAAPAAPQPSAAPDRITGDALPATLVQDVVVPVPGEVFLVLEKLNAPNWRALLRPGEARAASDRTRTALVLGTVIADGFLAVQAQDREEVKRIGRLVLTLSRAIGVRKSVVARSNSIIEAAEAQRWAVVRSELDKALQDVQAAMVELHDEQLAQLVSLGGWLRGTEVLSTVVGGAYSPDGAELLHQPALVEYFRGRIAGMDPKLKGNPLVTEIYVKLEEIRPIISLDNGRKITREDVERLRAISAGLLRSILEAAA